MLKRSGTVEEKKYARKIMPIIENSHFLLVTLLLCNAAAMEVGLRTGTLPTLQRVYVGTT